MTHTTHHDDCGCLTERYQELLAKYEAVALDLSACEDKRGEALDERDQALKLLREARGPVSFYWHKSNNELLNRIDAFLQGRK